MAWVWIMVLRVKNSVAFMLFAGTAALSFQKLPDREKAV